ncbi:MAG: phospholipase [Bacteroidales bacterium]|nr:phospholipase [Bacteroidales bacterium]MBD5224339.1 phospholipase [Bacteroidales bacterium]
MAVEFISGKNHYDKVIPRVASVRKSLWIGTADIKDLHIKAGTSSEPFLAVLAKLLKRGVEVRLIHAKEPGPAFREDFDRYPILKTGLERMLCPRVHFKMLIFDFETAYLGSANLAGAGIGMKSSKRRNFEAGILTDEASLIDAACEQFDSVWRGEHCTHCGRRQYCPDPIVAS